MNPLKNLIYISLTLAALNASAVNNVGVDSQGRSNATTDDQLALSIGQCMTRQQGVEAQLVCIGVARGKYGSLGNRNKALALSTGTCMRNYASRSDQMLCIKIAVGMPVASAQPATGEGSGSGSR